MKVVRLSAIRTGHLYARRQYFWYSFLFETESFPEPQCGRKHYANEKLHHRNRTRYVPTRSAVPHPTGPLRAPHLLALVLISIVISARNRTIWCSWIVTFIALENQKQKGGVVAAHAVNWYGWSGSTVCIVLNFSTRWRRVHLQAVSAFSAV